MSDTRSTASGDDDVLAGGFDQTNGIADGLDGESDGTADGELDPGAMRNGDMGVAAVDQQDAAVGESLAEDEGGRNVAAADTAEGRIP